MGREITSLSASEKKMRARRDGNTRVNDESSLPYFSYSFWATSARKVCCIANQFCNEHSKNNREKQLF